LCFIAHNDDYRMAKTIDDSIAFAAKRLGVSPSYSHYDKGAGKTLSRLLPGGFRAPSSRLYAAAEMI
jgi:hypothetical protein